VAVAVAFAELLQLLLQLRVWCQLSFGTSQLMHGRDSEVPMKVQQAVAVALAEVEKSLPPLPLPAHPAPQQQC
jgi:hypothetical protein